MPIITLTSDMGLKDYYVAAVKGAAYSAMPGITLVDISHQINPFDIAKAAFVLNNVWRDFPAGTVHIIAINPEWSKQTPYVIVENEGHYFIGADNGIFSLMFEEFRGSIWTLRLKVDEDLSFPTKNIFVKAAVHIVSGNDPADLGVPHESFLQRSVFKPTIDPHVIKGTVIYIDSYGNVITNITRVIFEKAVGNRDFHILVSRGDYDLSRISRTYNEVPEGEKVALFTSGGYLEIAINRGVEGSGGGASSLLGIKVNDLIRVEIEDHF